MFKKIILSLLIFVFQISICIANPIPVFCMFNYGFIKNSQEWSKACKGGINIFEYKYGDGDVYSKRYLLKDGLIFEYKYGDGDVYSKRYLLKDGLIFEYKYGDGDVYSKRYLLKK